MTKIEMKPFGRKGKRIERQIRAYIRRKADYNFCMARRSDEGFLGLAIKAGREVNSLSATLNAGRSWAGSSLLMCPKQAK